MSMGHFRGAHHSWELQLKGAGRLSAALRRDSNELVRFRATKHSCQVCFFRGTIATYVRYFRAREFRQECFCRPPPYGPFKEHPSPGTSMAAPFFGPACGSFSQAKRCILSAGGLERVILFRMTLTDYASNHVIKHLVHQGTFRNLDAVGFLG